MTSQNSSEDSLYVGGLCAVSLSRLRLSIQRVVSIAVGLPIVLVLSGTLLTSSLAEASPPPTTSPTELRLSLLELKTGKQLFVEVLKGQVTLSNGTVLLEGSSVPTPEASITFEPEMLLVVGDGGVTLRGKKYAAGTRLVVGKDGAILTRRANKQRTAAPSPKSAKQAP